MNRYKATLILIFVTIGYFITYPFKNSFVLCLLSSGFCAAMIGGFADWFGVDALFRKPLGVPFRTEIIPKNREKIFNALSSMVSDELLTKDILKEKLKKFSFSNLLIKLLIQNNEKVQLENGANVIIKDLLSKIQPEEAGKFIEDLAKSNIEKIKISVHVASAIEFSMKNGYDTKIINFLVEELIKLSKTPEINLFITSLVEETLKSYENGSSKRKFANKFLFDLFLQLSPSDIASIIQNKITDYLLELKEMDNPSRQNLIAWINEKSSALKHDYTIQNNFDSWVQEALLNKLQIKNALVDFIENNKLLQLDASDSLKDSSKLLSLTNGVNKQIESVIYNFEKNNVWQHKLDSNLNSFLLNFIDKNHNQISIIIMENLNKYTNEMLVELIESKAGDDLQMIRINGSVVGGLVGMLIFILNYFLQYLHT